MKSRFGLGNSTGGGGGRREDIGVEKIGEDGSEPDLQSFVVRGIIVGTTTSGGGGGRRCYALSEFVH